MKFPKVAITSTKVVKCATATDRQIFQKCHSRVHSTNEIGAFALGIETQLDETSKVCKLVSHHIDRIQLKQIGNGKLRIQRLFASLIF